MRATRGALPWLALALSACSGPPPVPAEAPVTPVRTAGTGVALDDVRRLLRDGLEQVPLELLVTRVHATLVEHGAAMVRVPHDDHAHHYVLAWVSGARTLVFFERTGDGVERLDACPTY